MVFYFRKYGKKNIFYLMTLDYFLIEELKERLKEKIKNLWHIGHNQ